MKRTNKPTDRPTDFADRLRTLTREFGSRYALAKATGIPASTLQGYEAGAKPGMDALLTLARVGNVDVRWLMTGEGTMRAPGTLSARDWLTFYWLSSTRWGVRSKSQCRSNESLLVDVCWRPGWALRSPLARPF